MTYNKRRTSCDVNPKRWAAYALAGVSSAFAQGHAVADITVIEPQFDLIDPVSGDSSGAFYSYNFGNASTFGGRAMFYQTQEPTASVGIMWIRQGLGGNDATIRFAGFSVSGTSFNYASNLNYGQNISTLSFFPRTNPLSGNRLELAWGHGYANSMFVNRDGYLAFEVELTQGTIYGWAELSLIDGTPENHFRLERIGFGDPGESVFVGQTTSIPEAGSLGLLALGAVGLNMWRRLRKKD